jgi:hypothetical protein
MVPWTSLPGVRLTLVRVEETKAFLRRGGRITIMAMDPDTPAEILEAMGCTLPNAPATAADFRRELQQGLGYLARARRDVGRAGDGLDYYGFTCLPLIHLCQFDDRVYQGIQLVCRGHEDDSHSLERLAIKTSIRSRLGNRLVKQFEWVQHNAARKVSWEEVRPLSKAHADVTNTENGKAALSQTFHIQHAELVSGVTNGDVHQVHVDGTEALRCLRTALQQDAGLDPSDIGELEQALERDETPAGAGRIGSHAEAWLDRTLARAADNAGDRALAVAGGAVMGALGHYLGLPPH